MIPKKENIKNNQELREFYEVELAQAWIDHENNMISTDCLMDIDWFYYENWVEPITEMGAIDLIYLNWVWYSQYIYSVWTIR